MDAAQGKLSTGFLTWWLTSGYSKHALYKEICYGCIVLNFENKVFKKKIVFDFCRFCVVIRFFISATTANDLPLWRIFIPDCIHYIYFPILILEKEPVFPFLMFSARQGHYWYHFYNVFGMTRSLTGDWTRDLPHSKPCIEYKVIKDGLNYKPLLVMFCCIFYKSYIYIKKHP